MPEKKAAGITPADEQAYPFRLSAPSAKRPPTISSAEAGNGAVTGCGVGVTAT
jgi:hypothetical protein